MNTYSPNTSKAPCEELTVLHTGDGLIYATESWMAAQLHGVRGSYGVISATDAWDLGIEVIYSRVAGKQRLLVRDSHEGGWLARGPNRAVLAAVLGRA